MSSSNGQGSNLGGRPTKFDPVFCEQARKLCRLGARDIDMADFFGVSVSTLYLWKAQDAQFSEAIKRGKKVADDLVEESLFRRATGYSHDAVKITTVSIGDGCSEVTEVPFVEHYPPDTTAMIFWLKNRRPGQWRDKQDVDHKVAGRLEVAWQPPEK